MNGEKKPLDKSQIRQIIAPWGVTYVGIADITQAQDYIRKAHGDALLDYPRAVSIGLAYPREIVNQLEKGPTHTYLYYYNVLNRMLDEMAITLANHLQSQGYAAFPIPASQRLGKDRLSGIFSHRLAANLAGLGWIGKNASLIHPQVGPRLRLVTVLTDCDLTPDAALKNGCGSCRLCVQACPADALTGVSFEENQDLHARFDGLRCDDYLSKVRSVFGKRVCGRCLAVCPYGKKGHQHERNKESKNP